MSISLSQRLNKLEETQPFLYGIVSPNITVPEFLTSTPIHYSLTTHSGLDTYFSYSNGIITILKQGIYSVSGSLNIDITLYDDRVNTRIRLLKNGSWNQGLPQSYGYSRFNAFVPYSTATINDVFLELDINDTIQFQATISKSAVQVFNSNFSGVQIFNGCTFSIKKI